MNILKEFVNLELEERECYPKAMHCILLGAQSLFLKSLIQTPVPISAFSGHYPWHQRKCQVMARESHSAVCKAL